MNVCVFWACTLPIKMHGTTTSRQPSLTTMSVRLQSLGRYFKFKINLDINVLSKRLPGNNAGT